MMHKIKRPSLHAPKLRVTRFANGRMKTVQKNYKPLLPHSSRPRDEHGAASLCTPAVCDSMDDADCGAYASYSDRKQQSVDEWRAARDELASALISAEGRQRDTCVECNKTARCIIRCIDCGPSYWACEECTVLRHALSGLHSLKIWKVRTAMACMLITFPFVCSSMCKQTVTVLPWVYQLLMCTTKYIHWVHIG
jgi:hypothetical protein